MARLRAFGGFLFLLVVFITIPVLFYAAFGLPVPQFPAFAIAMIGLIALGFKFWLAELMAKDETWTVHRSALDMTVALSATLSSLAVLQQFETTKVLFPVAALPLGYPVLMPPRFGPTEVAIARHHLWWMAATTWVLVFTAAWLAVGITAGRHSSRRLIACWAILTFTFMSSYILILYKA